MPVVEYKLEVVKPGEGATIPPGITESGYYYSPDDYTYLGWLDPTEGEHYKGKSATAKEITKTDAIDRVLAIHAQYPLMEGNQENPVQLTIEII